jgi:DNA-binding NarL/FixJ family response regulator
MLRVGLAVCQDVVVVGEAADGLDAVQEASRMQPDVVLLDLAMPRMDGLQAIPAIRRRAPGAKIIVLSGYERRRAAAVATELGADGYLDKRTPIADIADALLALCR